AREGTCGMSDARAAILERVRQAQRTARIPTGELANERVGELVNPNAGSPVHQFTNSPTHQLERFLSELTGLGVAHHVESSAEAVRARVRDLVGGRAVLAWDSDRLPYDVGTVLPGAATGASPRGVQAAAEIGVTGCDAAVAETGSLVVLSGPGKPRAA